MYRQLFIILFLLIILGGLVIFIKNQSINQLTNNMSPSQDNNQIIRQPTVAGQFYPDNQKDLNQMIDQFFNNTSNKKRTNPIYSSSPTLVMFSPVKRPAMVLKLFKIIHITQLSSLAQVTTSPSPTLLYTVET